MTSCFGGLESGVKRGGFFGLRVFNLRVKWGCEVLVVVFEF
jgi:hypothetical protein